MESNSGCAIVEANEKETKQRTEFDALGLSEECELIRFRDSYFLWKAKNGRVFRSSLSNNQFEFRQIEEGGKATVSFRFLDSPIIHRKDASHLVNWSDSLLKKVIVSLPEDHPYMDANYSDYHYEM